MSPAGFMNFRFEALRPLKAKSLVLGRWLIAPCGMAVVGP